MLLEPAAHLGAPGVVFGRQVDIHRQMMPRSSPRGTMLGVQQHPPGWYPNPTDASQLRWWDGNTWTDHTVPHPRWQPGWDAPPVRRRRIWPWIVFPLLGVFLVAGVSAAIFVPRVIGAFKHPIDAANVYYGDLRDGRLAD